MPEIHGRRRARPISINKSSILPAPAVSAGTSDSLYDMANLLADKPCLSWPRATARINARHSPREETDSATKLSRGSHRRLMMMRSLCVSARVSVLALPCRMRSLGLMRLVFNRLLSIVVVIEKQSRFARALPCGSRFKSPGIRH